MAKKKRLLVSFLRPRAEDELSSALAFWSARAAEGEIERFDSSIPPAPGTGFFLVEGAPEKLEAIRRHDEFRRLHPMTSQVWVGGVSSSASS